MIKQSFASDIPPTFSRRGIMKRGMLQVGMLGPLGFGLTDWMKLSAADPQREAQSKAKACILIWLDGGPSHLETFDPKPDAPPEIRGPLGTVGTSVPGVRLCEQLPRTATQMDKIAIVRSVTSPLGEHNFASHYALSGYKPSPALVYPSLPSVASYFSTSSSATTSAMPANIAIGKPNGMLTSGYLSKSNDPFVISGDAARPEFAVDDLQAPDGFSQTRLMRRRLMQQNIKRLAGATREQPTDSDDAFERAFRLLRSPETVNAFELNMESAKTRNSYGNHQLGQSCLMARRLVEAGSKFVTVTDRGWDTHEDLYTRLKEGFRGGSAGKLPKLDQAYSGLLADLDQRGLLDSTLVLVMGEFGRTPKLNPRGGRDHWPRVFSVAFAGGGVPGGRVVGSSDRHAESPSDGAVTPADVARTVYHHLGINPDATLRTNSGRPVMINQDGAVIGELT